MADATYPKIYRKQGAEILIIADGGSLDVESGGGIDIESGGSLDVESGGGIDIESGGSLDVESGGEIDIESGGSLKLAGAAITATAAELNELSGKGVVYEILETVSLAEINAGKTILAAAAGVTITVLDLKAKVVGNFGDVTSVLVQDTNGTPVVIATLAVAALTDGALINEATANVTMGAGYLAALTAAKGIQVIKSGSDATGGTSVTVRILYTVD